MAASYSGELMSNVSPSELAIRFQLPGGQPRARLASIGRGASSSGVGGFASLPGGIAAQRPQEVDLAERRPVSVTEVQFRRHGLPQQEVRSALLAAGADDEVGIGLSGWVEVAGNIVGRQGASFSA
jgi:hypothetical protein